jgi:hypothetical protein
MNKTTPTNTHPAAQKGGPAQPGTLELPQTNSHQKGQTHEFLDQHGAHRKARPTTARPRSHMECTRSHADRADASAAPTSSGIDGAGEREEARDVRRATSHTRGNSKIAELPPTGPGGRRSTAPDAERCARMADTSAAPPLSSPSSYSQISSKRGTPSHSGRLSNQLRIGHPLLCGLRGWRGRGCCHQERQELSDRLKTRVRRGTTPDLPKCADRHPGKERNLVDTPVFEQFKTAPDILN